jgi:hypothetical protein
MYKAVFRNKYLIILILMLLTQLFLVCIQSNVPRGSDQFWYIVDSESVAKNNYTTNNVFPNSLADDSDKLRPFVQNRPIVYIAGYLIKLGWDSIEAYKFINICSYISIIILLFFSLRALKISLDTSYCAVSVFISSPLIIFSIYNPLTNLFDAALFSIWNFTIFILFKGKSNTIEFAVYVIIIATCYFLLITQRTDFIMYLWGSLGVLMYKTLKNRSISIQRIIILSLLLILINYLNIASNYFPSHLAGVVPKHALFLTNVDVYFYNMISFFGKNSDFNHLTLMNIIGAKFSSFCRSAIQPFNLFAFLYLFFIFFPIIYKRFLYRNLETSEILFGIVALLNLSVLFGFQFQYRYSIFLIAPSVYVLFNLFKSKELAGINRFFMPFFLVLFVAVNFLAFEKVASESKESQRLSMQVHDLNLSKNSKAAVIYNGGSSLIWSWLLKDIREVHFFLPNEMGKLPNDAFDIEVHSKSSVKSSDELLDEGNYYKVGDYYIQLSDAKDFHD